MSLHMHRNNVTDSCNMYSQVSLHMDRKKHVTGGGNSNSLAGWVYTCTEIKHIAGGGNI